MFKSSPICVVNVLNGRSLFSWKIHISHITKIPMDIVSFVTLSLCITRLVWHLHQLDWGSQPPIIPLVRICTFLSRCFFHLESPDLWLWSFIEIVSSVFHSTDKAARSDSTYLVCLLFVCLFVCFFVFFFVVVFFYLYKALKYFLFFQILNVFDSWIPCQPDVEFNDI